MQFKKTPFTPNKGCSIDDFLKRFKKGSKNFRIIIDRAKYIGEANTDLTIVKTFARITNTSVPPSNVLSHFLSGWNFSYLDNKLRDFIYQCRQNILRTGDRLSHIMDTNKNCFFCRNLINPILCKESFNHLFRTCTVTSCILESFLLRYRIVILITDGTFDDAYWYGNINNSICKPVLLIFDIFRYCIWLEKCRKKIPRLNTIVELFTCILAGLLKRRPSMITSFAALPYLSNLLQAMG
jgi:hypothetical protein